MLIMFDEKVTDLPVVANALAADIIYAVQGGVSVQETLQQVLNLTQSNIILSGIGNPNGSVAGVVYQFYFDTSGQKLYVCTTTGSTTTAVWTLIASNGYVAPLSNGQLLIGSTGVNPVAATLTAGTNISIINSAGGITISGSGSAGFSWNSVTGTSQAMTANNGYVANNGSLVTLTLPTTAAFGTQIVVIGKGAGGWAIAQNASQSIVLGSSTTTPGIGGSLASTQAKDSVAMICTVADLEFTVISSIGNITIV